MTAEEINTLHVLKSKYPEYWEMVEEAAGELIDLIEFELDSVIESMGQFEITLTDEEGNFIVTIDVNDNTWEARYER